MAHITLTSVRLDNLSEEEAARHVVSAVERGEGGRPSTQCRRYAASCHGPQSGSLLQSVDLASPTGRRSRAARLQGSR